MSGIVGLVYLDGSPVDRQLLDGMTAFLASHGPDAEHIWVRESVGLGHTLLRTTPESANERQPATLDQHVWLVADARLDAREELAAELAAKGRLVSLSLPDAELILHAYHAWGEECVDHLLGDFSFAIWDAVRRRLFCARDHFGVRQFYYASTANRFVFSNSLKCLRTDPAIPSRLDDFAIGDLLLLTCNADPSATAFAEIRRLPPAHVLSVSDAGVSMRRYWSLPVEEEIRYRCESDYVDQFRQLLGHAVRDRCRAPRTSLLMSGGLDSSSVGAFAASAVPSAEDNVKAFTSHYERLIPDQEKDYAEQVARSLRIPIQFLPADGYNLFDDWEAVGACLPEPHPEALFATMRDLVREAVTLSRVALTGQGGDPALSSSVSQYARFLLRGGQLVRFARDFTRFFSSEDRFSRLYLATRFRVFRSRRSGAVKLPAWLNPEFSARYPLAERHARVFNEDSVHPLRPHAYASLTSPVWPDQFALYGPDATGFPVQFAHPYFDLRLVRFLLRLAPVPLCTDKEIVRLALRGMLPDAVRLRRKSPLAQEVIPILLRRGEQWWQKVPPSPGIEEFVQWSRLPHATAAENSEAAWPYVCAAALNLWLRSVNAKPETRPVGGPRPEVRSVSASSAS